MHNHFLCGRLDVDKNGALKKLELSKGGGSRTCEITHIDVGFDEIHDKLRKLFFIDDKQKTKLYDFQRKNLDTNRYHTFYEYVTQNGLKFNGTLLYIRVIDDTDGDHDTNRNNRTEQLRSKLKEKTPKPIRQTSSARACQAEADSSTPSVTIKPDNDLQLIQQSINQTRTVSRGVRPVANYSFEKSLNEFVDYLRNRIIPNNRENIFLLLFEHMCTIRGLASTVLDRLSSQINQSIDNHEKQIYNVTLEKVDDLSRTVKVFIELNKIKISNADPYSIISESFNQFHKNFENLRNQWINDNKQSSTNSNTIDLTIANVATSSHMNTRRSTRVESTKFSTSYTRTTSSCQYYSEIHTKKRQRESAHRHRRATRRRDRFNNYSFFKTLLKSFDHLLKILQNLKFKSFSYIVLEILKDIEKYRDNMNLSDKQSISNIRQYLCSVDQRLSNRMNDEYNRAAPHKLNQKLEEAYKAALDSMRGLLHRLELCSSQVKIEKHTKKTRWSSTNQELRYVESKPIINSNEQEQRNISDDQSSEASRSTLDDDVLMKVARDAFERR